MSGVGESYRSLRLSGDHTVVETPVPIPNTVVKHPGPMIVRALAKVGIARFIKNPVAKSHGVFVCAAPSWEELFGNLVLIYLTVLPILPKSAAWRPPNAPSANACPLAAAQLRWKLQERRPGRAFTRSASSFLSRHDLPFCPGRHGSRWLRARQSREIHRWTSVLTA